MLKNSVTGKIVTLTSLFPIFNFNYDLSYTTLLLRLKSFSTDQLHSQPAAWTAFHLHS